MKQAFRLSSARRAAHRFALSLLFMLGAIISASAQTPGPTPDPFIAQITASAANSFAYGISGNGRFVVVDSTGNLAPSDPLNPTSGRNNADGNREIFIYDYAQRRIFQITSTRHAVVDPTRPAINPSSATDFSNIAVEVSNNRPVISYDGKWIVFSSNAYVDGNAAATPKDFDGTSFRDQLKADGNQELFLYRIPDVPDVNLSSGAEAPFTNLAGGTLTRITATPASALPTAGTTNLPPFVADDNRFPSVNDDASIIAFISSRNIANVNSRSNADANPEVFVFNRNSGSFSQLTNTANPTGSAINLVYNANPSLSADGSTIAFASSANFAVAPTEATADQGNAEVFVANYNGTDMTNLRQVTRTPNDNVTGVLVNLFSFGRRLSRNGNFLLFESRSNLTATGTNNGDLTAYLAVYLYNVGANTLTQVGPRPTSGAGDVARYPTFTGDSSTIVFASALNFNADGSPATDTTGLNPPVNSQRRIQIFSAPVSSPSTFSRLTNVGTSAGGVGSDTTPYPAETLQRIAFTYSRTELGGGNSDNSSEAYYLLLPAQTSETPASANAVSFFTGASNRPVVSTVPSPNPNEAVAGLAPAMLGKARSTTVALAPSAREIDKNTPQDGRVPALPIELNGVSVSINNAAAGLYFVSPNQIDFVVPSGLAASTSTPYNVVINNNGAVVRSTLTINTSQPDIFTTTNDAGGRAIVQNVTNRCVAGTPEPADGFPATSTRPTNNDCSATTTETVATELMLMVTGVPPTATAAQVTVTLRSTRDVTPTVVSVTPSRTAGFQQIIVRLPADAAGLGDATVVVSINTGGQTNTSRSHATAPRIRIR
ncbi:MAG TPA: hypothetical protein VGB73_03795 [Pyrinomonadaceae bacterium]